MKTIYYSLLCIATMICSIHTSFAHFTTKGPYGGSVKCMLVMDTTIYIGTAEGGVYRSTNAAATSWRYANYAGLTSPNVLALTSIGRYVLAGTATSGVFRSSDRGDSWVAVNNGLSYKGIIAMVTIGNRVLAGSNYTLYSSRDSGLTWEQSSTGLQGGVSCLAIEGANVYAASGSNVYLSIDSGATWTSITTGYPISSIYALTVSGGKLFAASGNTVYVTSTSSINWQQTSITSQIPMMTYQLYASEGIVYASTYKGVFTSPDDSVVWTADTMGYGDRVNATVMYNGKLYAGTENDGIYRSNSTSVIEWAEFNTGLNNLKTTAIYNSGLLVIAATNKGLFVSRDLAANYTTANAGLTDSLNITSICFSNSKLYVSTTNGGVFVSSDTGTTWNTMNTGLPTKNISKLTVTDTRVFAAAASGNVYSTDLNTINWVTNYGLPADLYPSSMATNGSSHVFLGTNNGVYVCTDGTNWTANNTGLSGLYVNALAVSGTTLFAATNAGINTLVYKIPVTGGTWSEAGTGLPAKQILSLCAAGGWVAAGYQGGVHLMHDIGNTWEAPDVLMYIPSYAYVMSISFTSASTRIFVGTPNNSLYSNSIQEFPTGVNDIANMIGNIGVSPNPNNGQFHIDLSDMKAQVRSVHVYDPLGKLVEQKNVDKNARELDLSLNSSPGIYFVVVNTETGTVSQKILIR